MGTYIGDFGYLGDPPTRRYMEDLLKKWGYSMIGAEWGNTVVWTISTNQSQDNVQTTLDAAVSESGPYENGKLTDVKVRPKQ